MDELAPMGQEALAQASPDQLALQNDPTMTYWAALGQNLPQGPERETKLRLLVSSIEGKQDDYFQDARVRGFIGMWIISYAAWHGLDPESFVFSTQNLAFEGNQLEFVRLKVNIWRSYVQRQVTQVLSQDVSLKCIATNNDVSSKLSARLGDDILNYLFKRATQGMKLRDLETVAGFAGNSFAHLRWDQHAGDMVTTQTTVNAPQPDGSTLAVQVPNRQRSGASTVDVCMPWDCFQETRDKSKSLWRCVRARDNKHNVAATHAANDPELYRKIINESTDDRYEFETLFGMQSIIMKDDDCCTVLHFYHARCVSLPNGRYLRILGSIVLLDTECPLSEGVPVYELCPARFLETTFGYAPAWDLLSIQQALNQIVSDQLSNIATYGRQSIAMEKGTEITAQMLAIGQKGFFYPQGGKPPSAVLLNDIGTGPSVLQEYLHKMLDVVSGQNAASRGDPESNVKSGQFAALLHTIANEYMSYLQFSTNDCVEALGNGMLDMQRKYGGNTPFLVQLVGIDNRTYVHEYTGVDLEGFKGALVETVPPMLQNLAGRLDLHDKLKDYAPEDRAAAYAFIETGRSDEFMRRDRNGKLYIERENERMLSGQQVMVDEYDDPWAHCVEHASALHGLLASDRPDPNLAQLLRAHMAEHAFAYGNMHPLICLFLNIQPPPPVPGTPSFKFQQSVAMGQTMLAASGQPTQPGGGVQPKPQPQPGEAGSGRPRSSGSNGAPKPMQDNNPAGAAQPGGSGVDNTGVPLPKPAQPPPEAQV
jgi:hypothetical protein